MPLPQWEAFKRILDVQPIGAISESGGLGAFDMRPRRLVELGYATNLRTTRTGTGRQIHVCEFAGKITQAGFLADPEMQHTAFKQSMKLYHALLLDGRLKRPDGVSVAGALAILHRGGRGALEAWPSLFSDTRDLFEKVKELF